MPLMTFRGRGTWILLASGALVAALGIGAWAPWTSAATAVEAPSASVFPEQIARDDEAQPAHLEPGVRPEAHPPPNPEQRGEAASDAGSTFGVTLPAAAVLEATAAPAPPSAPAPASAPVEALAQPAPTGGGL